jgi:glycosyltransferase involved in cell wall biosynthesis
LTSLNKTPPRVTRMLNVVFAHDTWFHRGDDGRVFSDRAAWPWERYLAFSESLTVTSRMDDVTPDPSVGRFQEVSRAGVEFREVPSLSGPVRHFSNRREARTILTDALGRADGLVVRLPSEIGMLAIHVARRLGKPYAVEVVTCTWDALWNRGGLQAKLYAPVSFLAMRRVVRKAPFALYVTHEFLQRRYPTSGRSVACSNVDLPPLEEAVLVRRLDPARAGGAPFVIGTIAVISVRFKGIQTALSALASIRDRLPPFELQVVGPGDPRPWRELAARHGLQDRVSFLGTLPGERVPEWLDGVDLYVQPSFQEGLPRALIEAMSRGCPALGSTAGGIPELLEPDCLHRPGDARALAQLIVRAASRADWREAQARRNFATAQAYTATVLDAVRSEFWNEFASFARSRRAR